MNTPSNSSTVFLGSDNQAGAHPRILEALVAASSGFVSAYGEDALTHSVEQRINEVFERECTTFLVATGTSANSLILSAMCPPWGAIYCHEGAHIVNDENTAPEFFTGGARQVAIAGEGGKPDVALIAERVAAAGLHGVHNAKPAAISLTNATEYGTCYTPDELAAYSDLASRYGLGLHVDGARFSNAVAGTGASPAELTWKAGVDVLTFGATKNGAIAAEAVVFFNDRFVEDFAYRRKRAGHLWSKHRFLAAQFDAFLADDLWLANATHANRLASKLGRALAAIPGVSLPWPVEANEVFPVLPPSMAAGLERQGFAFYPWPVQSDMYRLVTSFATREDDIDRFIAAARSLAGS